MSRVAIFAILFAMPLSAGGDTPSPAAVQLKVPSEVKAAPAVITEVRAETAGKLVKWVVLTPGLSVRPIDDGRVLLVSGPAGRYELLAYTAAGDVPSEPSRCTVVIDESPRPDNPLRARLKAALDGYDAPNDLKREHARDLAALYRAGAKLAEDTSISTSGELLRRIRDAASQLIGSDSLAEVRRVVGRELATLLPIDALLTDSQRSSASSLFSQLASILEELMP